MRRMYSPKELLVTPGESNKVACEQFVSDVIVFNDWKPGFYAVEIKDTRNDINYGVYLFRVNSEDMTFKTPTFLDSMIDDSILLELVYSKEANTLTCNLYGLTQSPTSSDYHIDIFAI